MTACVKNHSKRVALAISASLVGALTLGAAVPAVAFADDGAATMDAAQSDQQQWEASTFEWSAPKDDYGVYTVEPGEVFALESVTDVFGETVNPGDYTVLYFTRNNANIVSGNTLVDKADAVNGQPGGMPKVAGDYVAVVFKLPATGLDGLTDTTTYGSVSGNVNHVQNFQVAPAKKTLEGAYAYEVNAGDASDTSDTYFMYTGNPISYGFADAEGNELTTADYSLTWISSAPGTDAGTYTAQLNGKGSYAGTSAKVSFTVDKLDFTKVTLTTELVAKGTNISAWFGASGNFVYDLYADGTPINAGAFDFQIYGKTDTDGTFYTQSANPTGASSGVFHFKSNVTTGDKNVIGGQATFDLVVVDQLANVTYDDEAIATAFLGGTMTVNLSKGQSFDPELFATDKGTVEVTATKDGQPVTEFTEPGNYKVHVEVPAPKSCAYGYSKDLTVVVIARKINGPCTAFVAVDGKSVATYDPSYTGEAIVPSVAVKDNNGKTVASDGYTVTYKDAEGEAVDSIVEPGKYTVEIAFPGTGVATIEVDLTVDKATVNSAKADQDLYAYTGKAITPSFTAYTGANLTGTAVELSGDGFGATYYKGKQITNPDGEKVWVADRTQQVNASNLKDKGVYFADVTVSSTNEHYKGTVKSVKFEISDYAVFSDVDAGSWYAQGVYNAAKLGYMNGVKGTDLFMPLADISRAELAKVFSNMAGRPDKEIYTPTQFGDVDAWAWYAEPIAWASEAGVVTGYQDGSGNFGPNDKATREQVALMLYRYAQAQGQDVSVEDADAALAAYSDGSEVSGWAKEAMAWAVENGVFGVDTDELMPQDNIQRAQVALIAVRYQPERLPEA